MAMIGDDRNGGAVLSQGGGGANYEIVYGSIAVYC